MKREPRDILFYVRYARILWHRLTCNMAMDFLVASQVVISQLYGCFFAFSIRGFFVQRYESNPAWKLEDSNLYYRWLQSYLNPTHKYTILFFLLIFFFFVANSLICVWYRKQKSDVLRKVFQRFVPFQVGGLFVLSFLGFKTGLLFDLFGVLITLFLFLFVVLGPILEGRGHCFWRSIRWFWPISLVLIVIQMVVAITAFIFDQPLILNEYFDIPSQTRIGSYHVDNISFINDNKIWGNQLRFDLRKDGGQDPECLVGNFLPVTFTNEQADLLSKVNPEKFYINSSSHRLCFLGRLTPDEQNIVNALSKDDSLSKSLTRIINEIGLNGQAFTSENHNDVRQFIQKNLFEWIQTIHDLELTFHHHFQLLNPIKELFLNRSPREIVALYGGQTLLLKKLIELIWGTLAYESFLKLIFFSYFVYFVLILVIAWLIFRKIQYLVLVAALFSSSVLGMGYLTLFTGLGYAPLRHGLDLLVIGGLYFYFVKNKSSGIILSIIFAVAGLLLDRSLGMFALLALVGVLLFEAICEQKLMKTGRLSLIFSIILLSCAVLFFTGRFFSASPYLTGFLDGVWGFPVSASEVFWIILGFFIAFGFIWTYFHRVGREKYFVCFLIFYCQIFFCYWLVIPNYGHRLVIYPLIGLGAVAIHRYLLQQCLPRRVATFVFCVMFGITALSFFSSSTGYWQSKSDYMNVFNNHYVFDWNFPNMRVRSTMDPRFFASATELIRSEASDRDGIFIISKYDTLLTFLANKYSLLPFFELGSFLNSKENVDRTYEAILEKRPEILFVDSDIMRFQGTSLPGQSISGLADVYLSKISLKNDRISKLSDLFKKVASRYELVKKTELLALYRLKEI